MSQMPESCEVCPTSLSQLRESGKTLTLFKTMWMCPSCLNTEKELSAKSEAEAEQRVAASRQLSSNLINQAREIDAQIQLKDDVFNAHTVAIMDLKKAIDEDSSIENKPLALATELHRRFTHLQQVIFDTRQILLDAGNQQRAIQTYMQTLANQLRQEERDKLRLQDINYTPESVKTPKIKKESTGKKRGPKKGFSVAECKEAAAKYNVPVELVRTRLIVKAGETPEIAAKEIAAKMGLLTTKAN